MYSLHRYDIDILLLLCSMHYRIVTLHVSTPRPVKCGGEPFLRRSLLSRLTPLS